ncbi:MAG: hypothetical protein AB1442_04925 [Nitrospirota bacterium]
MGNFHFTSKARIRHRDALENLLLFNRKQSNHVVGIEKSIEEFGVPAIADDGESLRIQVGSLRDVQCLFAFDGDAADADLVGVIIYHRQTFDNMTVLHIAVDEEYTFDGKFSDQILTIQLINRVREIALQIKGVESVTIAYTGLVFPVGR